MATNPTQNYEIPPEMRDFAEKSVEQARKAFPQGFEKLRSYLRLTQLDAEA